MAFCFPDTISFLNLKSYAEKKRDAAEYGGYERSVLVCDPKKIPGCSSENNRRHLKYSVHRYLVSISS